MNRHSNALLLSFIVLTPLAHAIDVFQTDIPLTITTPGTYVLQENIKYNGSHNAINLKSNNVTMDFNGFSLTLSKRKAVGVLIKNISNFTVKNATISNKSSRKQQGYGIEILKSSQGVIQNDVIMNNQNALYINQSDNIQVQNSNFSQAVQSAALVTDSTNITFDNDIFADSNNGLMINKANENIILTNSTFPTAMLSNLLVQQVNGMMVENCTFNNDGGDSAKANLVQFGEEEDPTQISNNVIIRNSTIINRPMHTPTLGNTAPEGITIFNGTGFLIDSCIIDIDNTDQDPDADLSGIHPIATSNTIIRNSIFQGPATNGIYPDEDSSGIVIENNLVSGALKDGIFLAATTASTVVGNTVINNGTNGIFLGEVSSSNVISNNVVNGNGFNPIASSIPPIGNGIAIATDSSMNIIQGNTVFNNAVNGIDDQGTNNQIINNIAYGNAGNNFSPATIIVSTPGSATLAGANISA